MSTSHTLVPIYTTKGDVGALLSYPYLYNPVGEWIGWVTPDSQVYSVHGQYVGWLSGDPRILRKPSDSFDMPRQKPPVAPPSIRVPARFPLPSMMRELTQGVIDVLEDMPDLLPCVDFGELREDMD